MSRACTANAALAVIQRDDISAGAYASAFRQQSAATGRLMTTPPTELVGIGAARSIVISAGADLLFHCSAIYQLHPMGALLLY